MWLAVMCSLHRMPGVSKPNYPIQPFLEVSSSGRTAGFDPAYRGSNPCTSAIYYMWASGEVGESQQTVNLSPLAE